MRMSKKKKKVRTYVTRSVIGRTAYANAESSVECTKNWRCKTGEKNDLRPADGLTLLRVWRDLRSKRVYAHMYLTLHRDASHVVHSGFQTPNAMNETSWIDLEIVFCNRGFATDARRSSPCLRKVLGVTYGMNETKLSKYSFYTNDSNDPKKLLVYYIF